MIYYALAKERSKFSSLVESAPRKCVSLRCTQKPTIVLRYYQTSWKIWINWQYQKAMNYIVYSKKISQYSYLIDIFSGNLTQAWLKKSTRLIKTKRILKRETYSAWCFQAVTHQSTNHVRSCLTSVSGRQSVVSTWYGRRHESVSLFDFKATHCLPPLIVNKFSNASTASTLELTQFKSGSAGALVHETVSKSFCVSEACF